jgi:hypothetical protein
MLCYAAWLGLLRVPQRLAGWGPLIAAGWRWRPTSGTRSCLCCRCVWVTAVFARELLPLRAPLPTDRGQLWERPGAAALQGGRGGHPARGAAAAERQDTPQPAAGQQGGRWTAGAAGGRGEAGVPVHVVTRPYSRPALTRLFSRPDVPAGGPATPPCRCPHSPRHSLCTVELLLIVQVAYPAAPAAAAAAAALPPLLLLLLLQCQDVVGQLVFDYLCQYGHWETAAAVGRDVLGGAVEVSGSPSSLSPRIGCPPNGGALQMVGAFQVVGPLKRWGLPNGGALQKVGALKWWGAACRAVVLR